MPFASSLRSPLLTTVFWTLPILLWDVFCLIFFVILLLPGFVRFSWFYWWSSRCSGSGSAGCKRESVVYGTDSCRQTLDVYSPITVPQTLPLPRENELLLAEQQQKIRPPSAPSPVQLRPVVVFFTGGAWVIGYKMWGALLARTLTAAGFVVVCPDYRNHVPCSGTNGGGSSSCCFCSGGTGAAGWSTEGCCCFSASTANNERRPSISDSVRDVRDALEWCRSSAVEKYGGDPKQIVVTGQSAGGHLAMVTLLRTAMANASPMSRKRRTQSQSEPQLHPSSEPTPVSPRTAVSMAAKTENDYDHEEDVYDDDYYYSEALSFPATDFLGFVSLSSPFCLIAQQAAFSRHGLNNTGFWESVFGDRPNDYFPLQMVQSFYQQQRTNANTGTTVESLQHPQQLSLHGHLPPIRLYHGTADRTVPHSSAVDFCQALQELGGSNSGANGGGTNGVFQLTSYQGWSHTHAILEGPMNADHRFTRDIFDSVQEWMTTRTPQSTSASMIETARLARSRTIAGNDVATEAQHQSSLIAWPDESSAVMQQLCPSRLLRLGTWFMPF